ncbi:site-specific integrase [Flaviaesturariibacter amylovorans]|uniref:Site-specific integrase n=1 Tax=Flaviaesturariibacter amylovorans TaxID=1084520 RepID=A0ABP8GL16_9BACT
MASVNLILDKRSTNKEGQNPIKLIVNYEGTQRRFSIREFSTPDAFKELSRSNKHHLKARWKELQAKVDKAEAIIEKLDFNFTWERFKANFNTEFDIVTKGTKIHLEALYQPMINEHEANGRFKSAAHYHNSITSLKKFAGDAVTLQDVKVEFLQRYKKHMLVQGRSISTVSTYLRPLKTVYLKAISDGLIGSGSYPFGKNGYKIGASRSAKSALNQDQIVALWNFKPRTEKQRQARSFWFFSHFCNGMAPVDIAHLKWTNIKNGHIVFYRRKTMHSNNTPEPIFIEINPHIQAIIDDYGSKDGPFIFPIIDPKATGKKQFTQAERWAKAVTKSLRWVSKELTPGVTINFYSARHTYANKMMINGVPVAHISAGLGHSDQKTTQNYLGTLPANIQKQYSRILTDFIEPDRKPILKAV